MIVELRQKSQVTIPADILKALNIKAGDKLEFTVQDGKIIVQPVVTVPKDQAWFWSENWQAEERIVDEQIKNGQVKSFDNIDALIEDLDT
ncbi:AbrB/MazE/SpoVT family DNA-binding domain-containing protein [Ruminiclostridium cellobioparum]|uniref:AbrB/MazE/SpoVT family DNA-binding domain-containing protein n=1 Tax=Ruminiclostridium cellobioparum TaxID=29355 RepID=UPI0028A94DBA|nr:AbrB/MazE/SpoVT family DNA-binding domain-containing protein [Ruminiclostridium cellobioparum]